MARGGDAGPRQCLDGSRLQRANHGISHDGGGRVAPVNLDDLELAYRAHVADLIARYAPVLAAAEVDAVVIHSGSPVKRTEFDDQFWPLRTTPHFQHWLPLAQADCALVVAPGKKPL